MAKKELVEQIVKLYSKLGGNMSDVLGSRSNVTFLGTGKNPEPFVEMDINIEAVGALGKSKILEELKGPMGYLTADKLNDVQATKLYKNMLKLEDFYYPKEVSNITDMATGTGELTPKGLAALRSRIDDKGLTDSPLDDLERIVDDFKPMGVGSQVARRNKEGVMAFDDADDIAAPFQSAEETFRKLEAQGQGDLAKQLQKAMMEGPLSKVGNKGDLPAKRGSAREFLVEALKEDDVLKTNLNSVISVEDVKYITEGGGGLAGDPLRLVEKYFGPRILEQLPAGATGEEIITFTKRVLNNVVDAAGNKPDSPRFDRFTARFVDEMADGGRVGMLSGGLLSKGIMGALEQIKNMDEGNLFSKLDPLGKAKTIKDALIDRIEGFKEIIKDLKTQGRPVDEIEDIKFEMDEAKDGLEKINKYIKNQPTNRTLQADGGRVGYRFGRSVFKGIADIFKRGADDVDLVKQEDQFRTGPITAQFLGDVDKRVIDKFIRTRDTKGPGSFGMYDNIAEMPQGLQAAEFISKIRIPGKNQIDYERAEMFIGGGVKLTGKESIDELIEMYLNAMKSYKSPFKAAKGGLAKILEV